MSNNNLPALEKLKSQYEQIDQKFKEDIQKSDGRVIYHWPGAPSQDIMLVVRKSNGHPESFHVHDYFYFIYAYKGEIEMIGNDLKTVIKLKEGDLYTGQPHTGHAFQAHDNDSTILVGLIIQKSAFYRKFMGSISADSNFFHFLMDRVEDFSSDKFIHLNLSENTTIRELIQIMVREFAAPKNYSSEMLRSLVVSFLIEVAREYSVQYPQNSNLIMQILMFMDAHLQTVTLAETAKHFGYHPNYLTALLKKEIGQSFSQILTVQRMHRSVILLKESNLSIDEIAEMVGYHMTSTFCKVFKSFYKKYPEEFKEIKENE